MVFAEYFLTIQPGWEKIRELVGHGRPTKRKLKVLSPDFQKGTCICSLQNVFSDVKDTVGSFLYLNSYLEQKFRFMDSAKFFMSPYLRNLFCCSAT